MTDPKQAILWLVIVLAIIGCKQPKPVTLDPSAPSAADRPIAELRSASSYVSMPVTIPFSEIQSVLEEKVPREQTGVEHPDVKDVTDERLEWRIARGPIGIETN